MIQTNPSNPILASWNELEINSAAAAIVPCNGSQAWVSGVVALRPFHTPDELFRASDRVWDSLTEADWQQAFDSHPRIGEREAKTTVLSEEARGTSLAWSATEQSSANPDATTQAALAAANREYEEKFGRIFIVCATGKSAAEMLAILRQRLSNDPHAELLEAAEQQRQITQLRLRKWLGIP